MLWLAFLNFVFFGFSRFSVRRRFRQRREALNGQCGQDIKKPRSSRGFLLRYLFFCPFAAAMPQTALHDGKDNSFPFPALMPDKEQKTDEG
jgi:hypothetical protein